MTTDIKIGQWYINSVSKLVVMVLAAPDIDDDSAKRVVVYCYSDARTIAAVRDHEFTAAFVPYQRTPKPGEVWKAEGREEVRVVCIDKDDVIYRYMDGAVRCSTKNTFIDLYQFLREVKS